MAKWKKITINEVSVIKRKIEYIKDTMNEMLAEERYSVSGTDIIGKTGDILNFGKITECSTHYTYTPGTYDLDSFNMDEYLWVTDESQ